jgi:hypothetical protein
MRAVLVLLAACSASRVPDVRFANAPPVRVVDDRRDVAVAPDKRVKYRFLDHYDGVFFRRISRALSLPRARRALGVNAHDEVPDSTWFTNRIGVRDMTLDELRAGPSVDGSPEEHKPWKVVSAKSGGSALGFVIEDARGSKWLVKFEERGYAELESATDAIASRLVWAAGYNVPEDHVVYVRPDELAVPARLRANVDRNLANADVSEDGTLRALASRFVAGKLLGGHPAEGVRAGDVNDRIPHELRRDLRGAYVLFAWLDHVDVKEDNTLDTWIADGAKHYLRHYFVDFGKSFGVLATMGRNLRMGHTYVIDFREIIQSFASAGLAEQHWVNRSAPVLRGVGLFEAKTYDPGAWKPLTPSYVPFHTADDRDKLWGSKILMRFTPEQIRAVVETGRYSDPRAAEYVVATLIARQRATARYWFERTSALDRFTIDRGQLCFEDLSLVYGLVDAETRYVVRRYNRRETPISSAFVVHPGAGGRTCMPLGLAIDGYTIIEIATERDRHAHAIYVHVARDEHGAPRVIGIWRP